MTAGLACQLERRITMADEKNIGTPAEEEIEIITLTDENGEDMDFEFLDLVEYEGKRYAVLLPPVEDILTAVFDIFKEKFKDEFDFAEE